jgi:tetratricopeptide (TPR) repeat protein
VDSNTRPDPAIRGHDRDPSVSIGRDNYAPIVIGNNNWVGPPPSFALRPLGGRPELAKDAAPSLALVARYELVNFTGRDAEVVELLSWLRLPPQRAVRLITAPGGRGKTRLGLHVCRRAELAGWHVLEARHKLDGGTLEPLSLRVESTPAQAAKGTLVLLDYADRWPLDDLIDLFSMLSRKPGPLRVLLLARSGAFWPSLRSPLRDASFEVTGEALLALAEDLSRWQLYESAASRFSEFFGVEGVPVGKMDLAGPEFDGVLAVHMSALASVLSVRSWPKRGHPPVLPVDPSVATEELIDHELRHWGRLASKQPHLFRISPQIMARAVFVATVAGGLDHPRAIRILADASIGADPQVVIDAHRMCYPSSQANVALEPLLPDFLGEDFVARVIPGAARRGEVDLGISDPAAFSILHCMLGTASPNQVGPGLGLRNPYGVARSVLANLIEVGSRWPHVFYQTVKPLLDSDPAFLLEAGGQALVQLSASPAAVDRLPAVGESLDQKLGPDLSLDFTYGAVAVAEQLVSRARTIGDAPELAKSLNRLSLRLASAGDGERALRASTEALQICRRLAQEDPDKWTPELGKILHNHALWLFQAGRRAEAVASSTEAVEIRRALHTDDPQVWLPNLASSLVHHAMALGGVGRLDEALAVSAEAVDHLRVLAAESGSRHVPRLAAALNNHSKRLYNAQRASEAVRYSLESANLYAALARDNPDAWIPNLAMAQNNYAMCLIAAGKDQEAIDFFRHAIAALVDPVTTNPDAWLHLLAQAVHNLSEQLQKDDRGIASEDVWSDVGSGLPQSCGKFWDYLRNLWALLSQTDADGRHAYLAAHPELLDPSREALLTQVLRTRPVEEITEVTASIHRAQKGLGGQDLGVTKSNYGS